MEPSPLQFSPLDSARFGLRVARATLDEVDAAALIREIMEARVDVAILRVATACSPRLQRLSTAGLHPVHADTLVYYNVDLASHAPHPLRNPLEFRRAEARDSSALSELIGYTFAGYRSHYHANPRFLPDLVLEGYKEWARGYLDGSDGRETWVAQLDGSVVAFACCLAPKDSPECEGVLYGVHPSHAGGGMYGDLIRYTQATYKERGFARMAVSTQVHNFAVQKVWAREGFALSRAYDTFHVNALLDCGSTAAEREIRFTASDVARFAEVSGDRNGIHLDDDAAKAAGFEGRLSHGMLAGAEFSRIFGMEVPGPGTLFLRSELAFVRPIYADRAYRLKVRFPDGVPVSGFATAVGTIEDPSGSLCLVSYHDLLKRN